MVVIILILIGNIGARTGANGRRQVRAGGGRGARNRARIVGIRGSTEYGSTAGSITLGGSALTYSWIAGSVGSGTAGALVASIRRLTCTATSYVAALNAEPRSRSTS